MPPRNPSELQRLEEELAHYKEQMRNCPTKAGKEMMLRHVRACEAALGLEPENYNGVSTRK